MQALNDYIIVVPDKKGFWNNGPYNTGTVDSVSTQLTDHPVKSGDEVWFVESEIVAEGFMAVSYKNIIAIL